ncbi:arginyltransferase [Sulfurimonas sp. HSL-1716]|uniref:arginyltransferase n=1 Tax=Hydrocurvibacter sulfurireducens TaxID=3131937 RepID=UPI0031FA0748
MKLLKECTLTDKCSYLQNKEQTAHYKILSECSSAYCMTLTQRGWRRFGKMFFRPICEGCSECQSVKIDAQNYNFSKSERRIIRKNSHIKTVLQHPTVTQKHIDLFNKYHRYMHQKKGWDNNQTDAKNYYTSFVSGHDSFGHEVLYYDQDKLIGVDLIDILDNGISSIYFYYDPEYKNLSLGKYSLYRQIAFAKIYDKKWIYLGYYVKECESLSYKSQFKPYLTLQGRPLEEQEDIWD